MTVKPVRTDTPPEDPDARPRFLSETDCRDIAQRLARTAKGGGDTKVSIVSQWTGNVRWARNRISTTGEDRDNHIFVKRAIRGAESGVMIDDISDEALVAANRQAERLARLEHEHVDSDLESRPGSPFRYQDEPFVAPQLFIDATYQMDAGRRAAVARRLAKSAADAGMLSAGYIEVSATSLAYITSWGYTRYYQYTWAQYSVTVRDPKGVGSGWAGVDWPDWNKIDGPALSALALDKCLKSRNPVAVEPGRYTTILEPQAVCDFVGNLMGSFDREHNETNPNASFVKTPGNEPPDLGSSPLGLSLLGERVVDARLTIGADPMDPELGFPPFENPALSGERTAYYHPATWIERGVLKTMSYDRYYAAKEFGRNTGLPDSGSLRISVDGAPTSMEEMIAATKRGLLVTRFDLVEDFGGKSILCRGYTRDGLWLIENGKLSKAVKNMSFVESVLFALNNIEQLGTPQRTFHPPRIWVSNPQPVIVPAMKVRDFSFTSLSGAI